MADFSINGEARLDTSEVNKSVSGMSALMQTGMNAVSVAMGNLLTKLAAQAVQMVSTVVSTGLDFNRQMENYQLAFQNLLGDAQAANDALDAIKADAASTPFDVAGLVSANRLLISTGQSAEEARQVINALGNAVSASGGGNEELQRMAANLQQIANVGQAAAVDIKQFAYAGIDIYGILSDYTGKSREEVQKLKISYDLLAEALKAASEEGGRYAGAMEAYSQTLQGRMDTLADNATQLAGALTEGLFEVQKELVEAASGWVETLQTTLEAEGPAAMAVAGVQIVFDLLQGVASALPDVAASAVQTVAQFLQGIVQNLPALLASGGQIVGTLIEGILSSLPDLASCAGGLASTIIETLFTTDWLSVGWQIVSGIGSGLLSGLASVGQSILDWASGVAQGVADTLTFKLTPEEMDTNPYHKGSVKDDNYWKQVGEHFKATGRDQRNGNYTVTTQQAAGATFDLDKYLQGLGETGKTTGTALKGTAEQVETLEDKITKADKALTESQNAYQTLTDAVQEYSEKGAISLSTWQDLMDLAPEYQALLSKQGDQLVIDTAAYNELTAAQRLEIETLVTQNGVTADTIQLLDSLGLAAEENADKAGTAFSELKEKLDGLTKDGPLAVIADLASALKDGDWSGAAQAVAEGLWLTITPDQQDAIAGWAVQAVQFMTDGFTSDGWAGLINAGATIVQGLAEGITSGRGVFVEAAQGLISTFSGLGESVMPAVGNAVMSLLGALNTLVPGIDLASAATAVFNAILDANPIILVISLIGMLASALYGFAQTNTKVGETIRNIWDGIVNAVRSALQFVLGMIEGVFEAAFAAWNLFVKVAGKYLGLKEIHFDFTSWLDPKEDNDEALEENTEAIKENTELIRNPPRYQSGGSGPTGGVTDYSAMLAAARAEVLAQNTRVVSNYDAGSGQTAARLNASWYGTSTTVLELDGREVARAVTPYVDEDLAF